ncbi:MAG: hypothetical protein GTO00_12795 [Deltaproteobacteria bacterium]|nr:hypothetical protein [Deltaproteobacteria bacterium]
MPLKIFSDIFHFVLMPNHYNMIVHLSQENQHRLLPFLNAMVALLQNMREQRSDYL